VLGFSRLRGWDKWSPAMGGSMQSACVGGVTNHCGGVSGHQQRSGRQAEAAYRFAADLKS
jgi:hypothetical protein